MSKKSHKKSQFGYFGPGTNAPDPAKLSQSIDFIEVKLQCQYLRLWHGSCIT